jgi:putative ABC transport system permease protein
MPSAKNASATAVSVWRWAWTQTRRDLRASAMRFLLVAVVLAVGALSAVGFFADRIERGLQRDAAQLLGADLLVVADQPVPAGLGEQARQMGLRVAGTAVFSSMARLPDERGGEARLVALKAVSPNYPLRGHLKLGRQGDDGKVQTQGVAPVGGPPAGQAWVDAALLSALNLKVGEDLWLGEARFRVAALIASEPDRGAGFGTFAPRVMIRLADLPATQLVQPASRITYRLLVAGAPRQGDADQTAAKPGSVPLPAMPNADATSASPARAGPDAALRAFADAAHKVVDGARGMQIETLDNGRPEMRATIDRAGLFLRLVALLAGLLSAVAVALVSRDFAQRRLNDCALLRVLGVSQSLMARAYALEFAWMGLGASLVGLLLGWLCHLVFVALLGQLLMVELPPPGWQPAALGLGVGVLLTLGFGLPPVLQLASVPPMRVLRRDLGQIRPWSALVWLLGGAALTGMLMMVARDIKLGGIALGGFAVAVLVFAGLSALAVYVLQGFVSRFADRLPMWWTLGTRQLTAQPGHTVVQVCALGIGLLALMLLVLVRTSLIQSWRASTPADAPNRFVINIQPAEVDAFQKLIRDAGVSHFDWYPMSRGRLVSVNGKPVSAKDYDSERAQRLVDREFNLSHAAQSPSHNQIVAGRYTPEEAEAFSVEEGLAKTLHLKLGDRLGFDLAGQPMAGRITSLRKVDWTSMRVNFFVMAPRAQMPEWPITYITAFKMPPGTTLDRDMVAQFPSLTVIDVSVTLAQIQGVLEQVITAVQFLFAFTLATGVIVLMAGLMTSRERRAREWAVLRSLGASRQLLGRVQAVELLGLGLLAGGLAATAALAVGGALAHFVFEFEWQAPWWWPLAGALLGGLLALGAGWWSLRGVTQRPVTATLRATD